jgi:3-methyl-2-oxobutanoate hydroxymethyltransferase
MNYHFDNFKTLTISDLNLMKLSKEKISCLTAYDASFSFLLDKVGIDVMLVGDSLGMVIQGHKTTLPVTITDMVYHTRNVVTARKRAFIISDMPFASYATPEQALLNATLLMQKGEAQMVKLEGDKKEIIEFLVQQGIPVCAHLGLLPQSINCIGGYKVQGKDKAQAQEIILAAKRMEAAGAGLLVLECVPALLASEISNLLNIPVIGIGAGNGCDGQVLVLYDLLGLTPGEQPRFSKNFLTEANNIESAIRNYHQAVKSIQFPDSQHSY